MRPPLYYLLLLSFAVSISLSSCKNNTEPGENALILEFSIQELPQTTFTIDHGAKVISPINPGSIDSGIDSTALTAVFEASEGATITLSNSPQASGKTVNNFEEGIFYTVVSEDKLYSNNYFVHLEPELPLTYLLTDDPDVYLNPSQRNPLSAEITFGTRGNATASIKVLGDIPIEKEFSSVGDLHHVPVLGLYPNHENKVILTVSKENVDVSDTLLIQTEPLPDFLPTPEINVLNESQMEPGMHFNEVHIGNAGTFNTHPIIFDNNGDIRWYMDLSEHGKITWPIQFNDDDTFFAVYGVTIFEYDMLGNELNRTVVEGNEMHHEVIKLPNDNYVVAVSRLGINMIKNGEEMKSVEDYIIEVDPTTGTIVTEWDMAEVLDVNRTTLTDGGVDWFHMNAIWYDESDESLIVSGRNQGLVKVNWDNELQWILAPHKGWGKAGRFEKTEETAPYLLTAVSQNGEAFPEDIQSGDRESNQFSWSWGQHAPLILPNGNLLVFDNGYNRNFGAAPSYSLAIEYEIDEENMTVQEVWRYGQQQGDELYSSIISDVDYLPQTGNRLFVPGVVQTSSPSYSKVIELAYPSKEVIFESTLYFKNQLVDGPGWGNLDINYRAERVQLYQQDFYPVAVP
jgi:arylsulfate sulfotransferase